MMVGYARVSAGNGLRWHQYVYPVQAQRDSEFADFETELRNAGRDLSEFDVSERTEPPAPHELSDVFIERRAVTVTNKKTGIAAPTTQAATECIGLSISPTT